MRGQRARILEHLQTKGSITSMEAFQLYGATRLSAIIFALREMGYDIETHDVSAINRYGEKTTFARYKYLGKEN